MVRMGLYTSPFLESHRTSVWRVPNGFRVMEFSSGVGTKVVGDYQSLNYARFIAKQIVHLVD